ncbi:hypothetical protein FisN_9Lh299 [Fistulifera solaris]|uniref:Uncharacterized protein n=1 Tax=Fistulifera solaris TaxID=1519565 RepID=A0A1Z5KLT4_FISSO|nr:hypothetical protein FisN_9Lh299 [Fistulifera solaris]|eukprot:GAX26991.1 hypothetical protein FisN_9Lh299 [Fistulifera solaris]
MFQQLAHRKRQNLEVQGEVSPLTSQRKRRRQRTWTKAQVIASCLLLLLVISTAALMLLIFLGFVLRTPRKQPIIPGQIYIPHEPNLHQIPQRLVFTHRYNLLLDDWKDDPQNDITTEELDELMVLQKNVRDIVNKHPSASVEFYTDEDCIEALTHVAPSTQQDEWVHYFRSESKGMFKADWCRGVALLEQGGVYFDVDLGVRQNVFEVLQRNTTLATVKVHRQSQHPGAFFQAFIAVAPKHPVMQRYVDLFAEYYAGKNPAKGPLGVLFLRQAFDELVAEQPAINATTELWQEVLYQKSMKPYLSDDFEPPVWGTRRACHFLVVARLEVPLVVPFYSRIAGSRMCPLQHHR